MQGNKLGTLAAAHPPITEKTRQKLKKSHEGKTRTENSVEIRVRTCFRYGKIQPFV
jgi:hypothetical protein